MGVVGQDADLRRAHQALVVAATAMLLVSFVGTATNIAVPVLAKDFPGERLTTISWVVSGFNVAQATLMLVGGRLADRLGRRRVFLAGMAVFAAGAVGSGLAPGIELIIVARVVQAIGVAMILPSSLAAVLPEFPVERHASVVSLWSSLGVLGSAVAPTLTAGLLEVATWRFVFLLAAPIALIALVFGLRVLSPGVRPAHPAPLDVIGSVAGTVGVGGAAFVIVQGRAWGWGDPAILLAGAVALAAGVVFVRRSRRHPEPLVDFGLFRIRSFSVVSCAIALLSISTTATWFLYPLFMAEIWHYPVFRIGLAMTPGPLALVVVAVFAGRYADRHGYRTLLVLGSTVPALGTAWMAWFLAPGRPYAVAFLPGTLMIGFGMGLVYGPANAAALREVPAAQLGAANAAYNTLRFLGGALGVAIAAAILGGVDRGNRLHTFKIAWWTVVALMSLAPPLLWALYPRGGSGAGVGTAAAPASKGIRPARP